MYVSTKFDLGLCAWIKNNRHQATLVRAYLPLYDSEKVTKFGHVRPSDCPTLESPDVAF